MERPHFNEYPDTGAIALIVDADLLRGPSEMSPNTLEVGTEVVVIFNDLIEDGLASIHDNLVPCLPRQYLGDLDPRSNDLATRTAILDLFNRFGDYMRWKKEGPDSLLPANIVPLPEG